jgi:hypothetical protein
MASFTIFPPICFLSLFTNIGTSPSLDFLPPFLPISTALKPPNKSVEAKASTVLTLLGPSHPFHSLTRSLARSRSQSLPLSLSFFPFLSLPFLLLSPLSSLLLSSLFPPLSLLISISPPSPPLRLSAVEYLIDRYRFLRIVRYCCKRARGPRDCDGERWVGRGWVGGMTRLARLGATRLNAKFDRFFP